eukprot:gene1436-1581_t
MDVLVSAPEESLGATVDRYQAKYPGSLVKEFKDRRKKNDAVAAYKNRYSTPFQLYPNVEDQEQLQVAETMQAAAVPAHTERRQPRCKKCGNLRKGHPRNACP